MPHQAGPVTSTVLLDAYDSVAARLRELGETETAETVQVLREAYVVAMEFGDQLYAKTQEFRKITDQALALTKPFTD